MAVDTTPATTVKNMLNGIDYSALIGGPLKAAIEAQAMAAKSSWEFIEHVGLTKNKKGETCAINVAFMYQKDGSLVKLIVPILTIVPIPMIVIDNVDIKFKASLNASASEYSENSSSEALDVGGEGSMSFSKGLFSIDLKVKANYSTKKDSKATQDSRYSVEYTQDVEVHARQADMPAGLSTVLNILSNSITPNAGANGKIELDKTSIAPTVNKSEVISIVVKDGEGIIVPNSIVTVKSEFGPDSTTEKKANIALYHGHLQKEIKLNDTGVNFNLEDGVDTLTFKVKGPIPPGIITLTYSDKDNNETTSKIKIAEFAVAAKTTPTPPPTSNP